MHRLRFVILISIICISSAESSEIVNIPLSELHGVYEYPAHLSRSAHFELDRIPDEIYKVSLKVSGTSQVGTAMCSYPDEFPYKIEILTSAQDPLNSTFWFQAVMQPDYDSDIEIDLIFVKSAESEATWDFLKLGEGNVNLGMSLIPLLPGCIIIDFPTMTISEAILIIEADWALQAEGTTWGRIKALTK